MMLIIFFQVIQCLFLLNHGNDGRVLFCECFKSYILSLSMFVCTKILLIFIYVLVQEQKFCRCCWFYDFIYSLSQPLWCSRHGTNFDSMAFKNFQMASTDSLNFSYECRYCWWRKNEIFQELFLLLCFLLPILLVLARQVGRSIGYHNSCYGGGYGGKASLDDKQILSDLWVI